MMKNKILALYLGFLPLLATAQNPIIQTKYTADPAPMVHNDTLFLYVGCDEKDAPSNAYLMREYRLYTTTDMVNWTDHGTVATTKTFPWREEQNGAWAMQVVERNGKFYMYCTVQGNGIGVLVSDSPYGPFKALSANRWYGKKELVMISTLRYSSMTTGRLTCIGATPTFIT